jgi:hypothetical protein
MARRNRRNKDGAFSVSGPGYEKAGLPTEGAAIAAAQSAAHRLKRDGTWYVRGTSPRATFAIEQRGKVTHTTPISAAS